MSAERRDKGLETRRVENIDRQLRSKNRDKWIKCPKGHLNSPIASICWKCGLPLKPRKKEEVSMNV